jgi:multiple sugar transport system ATP-binding protein
VGRAIIRDPEVFLFDEPLSNLDAKLRTTMRGELIKLHQRLDATMVYVTHDQVEAMTMGDRIVVMDRGVVQQVGPPLEIYDDPDNLFVAGFIGSPSMNLFSARVSRTEAGVTAELGALAMRLPSRHPAGLAEKAVLGIRPEFLKLGPSGGEIRLPVRVDTVEHLGAETLLEVSAGGFQAMAKVERQGALRPGAHIELSTMADKVLAFDAMSGRRLRAGPGA